MQIKYSVRFTKKIPRFSHGKAKECVQATYWHLSYRQCDVYSWYRPNGSFSPAAATELGMDAASPVITNCFGTPT
jgi:hypothetical protein